MVDDSPFYPSELALREQFGLWLNERNLLGLAVEVGTHRAEFACDLLAFWRGQKLFCVDPWLTELPGYRDVLATRERKQDYLTALGRLNQYGPRCRVLRLTSAQAAATFTDKTLCFVYLDGDHSYAAIRQDLTLWWPKIQPGGVLAGHDLNNDFCDTVGRAVKEFCLERGLRCGVVPGDMESWHITVPN